MNESIPAVFVEGVFRPLGPVDLAEGTQVTIPLPQASETVSGELSPEQLAKQRAAIEAMLAEIERLAARGSGRRLLGSRSRQDSLRPAVICP